MGAPVEMCEGAREKLSKRGFVTSVWKRGTISEREVNK